MALIESELSELIIGCAIRVHKTLGPGFLEKVYEEALTIELQKANVMFERQKSVSVYYDGQTVGVHRLDLVVAGRIVLELKASRALDDVCHATLRSYLKATGLPVGLLVNFARPTLEVKRVVLTA